MHKGFPDFPGKHAPPLTFILVLWEVQTLPQDGQSEHHICLRQGLVGGWACDSDKTNQKHGDSILRLCLNCWESGLFLFFFLAPAKSVDSHLATTAQKEMAGDAEG